MLQFIYKIIKHTVYLAGYRICGFGSSRKFYFIISLYFLLLLLVAVMAHNFWMLSHLLHKTVSTSGCTYESTHTHIQHILNKSKMSLWTSKVEKEKEKRKHRTKKKLRNIFRTGHWLNHWIWKQKFLPLYQLDTSSNT